MMLSFNLVSHFASQNLKNCSLTLAYDLRNCGRLTMPLGIIDIKWFQRPTPSVNLDLHFETQFLNSVKVIDN